MNYYRLLMIIIIFSALIFVPGYQLAAAQDTEEYYEEDFEDEDLYYEDYPPINMEVWPQLQYVLEVKSPMLETGAVSRQYFGNRAIRLETIAGEEEYFLIYRFNEEGAVQFSFLENEDGKKYLKTLMSYEEFFDEFDSYDSLFFKTLPGEELAMPGYEKEGEEVFLDRKVEAWSFIDNSEGDPVKIELLIDRELRQTLKIIYGGEIVYEVTKIEVRELSSDLFNPPGDYEKVEY